MNPFDRFPSPVEDLFDDDTDGTFDPELDVWKAA